MKFTVQDMTFDTEDHSEYAAAMEAFNHPADLEAEEPMNIDIVNNTGSDIRLYEAVILEALRTTGALPEDFADLFTVARLDGLNPNGSPRFRLDAA